MPAGNRSLSVVVPDESDGPLLVTVILYLPVPPAVNWPTVVLAATRSNEVVTGVVPLEDGPLLVLLLSPGLLTMTKLAARLPVALEATVTFRNSTLGPPAGIGFGLVQVTFGTLPVHIQPGVEPPPTR